MIPVEEMMGESRGRVAGPGNEGRGTKTGQRWVCSPLWTSEELKGPRRLDVGW